MTKKQALGYFFMTAIAVFSVVGILGVVNMACFHVPNGNSDGAWNFESIVAGELSLLLGVACAFRVFGICLRPVLYYRLVRRPWWPQMVADQRLRDPGDFRLRREFDGNRRQADNAVQALE